MNKPEFVDYVADELGATKKDTKVYVDAVFDSIAALLDQGEKVSIQGFGEFSTINRETPVIRRNPKTGENVEVPPHRDLKFVYSKTLKKNLR